MNWQDIVVWVLIGLTIMAFSWRIVRRNSARKPGCGGGGCDCNRKN